MIGAELETEAILHGSNLEVTKSTVEFNTSLPQQHFGFFTQITLHPASIRALQIRITLHPALRRPSLRTPRRVGRRVGLRSVDMVCAATILANQTVPYYVSHPSSTADRSHQIGAAW